MLFVVGLWVAGGGLIDFGSPGESLTNLGRLTGLLASVLILLQVLLMARIPIVEQAWGQDELARVHRLVGFTSFNLMLAHIVLTTLGYSAGTDLGVIATFVDEVLHSPGMLLALAGALALVMVVVTSVKKARRRLRYESWHLLHLYAYLGAGLALPHQLWSGADFRASTVATVFWWGLYAAALASVLAFRVLLPLIRSRRHRLVVSQVRAESPTVTTVVVTGRRLDRLPVRAGQFFHWRFLDGEGSSRANPFSLSAAPDGRSLRITAAAVGDSTAGSLPCNPARRSSSRDRTAGCTRACAPGNGPCSSAPASASLRCARCWRSCRRGPTPPSSSTVSAGSPTSSWPRSCSTSRGARGARVVAVVGHRRTDRRSWLPADCAHLGEAEGLLRIVPDIAHRDVYVCGSPAWMDAVIAAATEAGVPAASIHHERFSY